MTYEYIGSQCQSRDIGSQWTIADVKFAKLDSLYETLSRFYLKLFNTVLQRECIVDMIAMRSSYRTYSGTVSQWLIDIGDMSLPEVETLPDPTIRFANYGNVLQAGYKIHLVDRTQETGLNYPKELLNDAQLLRASIDTDYERLHTHCIPMVRGFAHNSDTDGAHYFIVDAGKVLRKVTQAHIGILSFSSIGQVKKVSIPPATIHRVDADVPLFKKLVFTTEESMVGKSFILSLGGYLYFPRPDIFFQSGESSFTLVLENANYIERYLESKDILDLSSLGLPPMDNNLDAVAKDNLISDETIRKYFALSQSFLAIVDTPHLTVRKMALRNNHVPGTYTTNINPVFPVVTGYGRMPGYWKTCERGVWSLKVDDNYLRPYISRQRELRNVTVISDFLSSTRPQDIANGYMLEISTAG